MPRQSKVYNLKDEDFKELIQNSYSFAECARKIGLSVNGKNATIQIKKRCEELGLSLEHFNPMKAAHERTKQSLEEILIKDSNYRNSDRLKKRLIKENILQYKCAICGNEGEWNGLPLSLQLDHINGNHFDNRIENLRILCPNCHSQTNTYSGKNT